MVHKSDRGEPPAAAATHPPAAPAPTPAPETTEICEESLCAVCLTDAQTAAPDDVESGSRPRGDPCGETEVLKYEQCRRVVLSSWLQQQQIASHINGCLRLSACGHTFHEHCIVDWLRHSVASGRSHRSRDGPMASCEPTGSCPLCRWAIKIPLDPCGLIGTRELETPGGGSYARQAAAALNWPARRAPGRHQWMTNHKSTCVFVSFLIALFGTVLMFSIRGALGCVATDADSSGTLC